MGRPKGIDVKKLQKIIDLLAKYPDGLWIREIARKTGLNPNTVSSYVDQNDMYFKIMPVGSSEKTVFKIIKLRPNAQSRASEVLQKIINEQ